MGRMAVPAWLDFGRARLLRGLPRFDDAQDSGPTTSPAAATAVSGKLGVLSLEASGLLSRVAHLWYSLANDQISFLRDDVFGLEGVQKLVSTDRTFLSGLALSEMLDDLASTSRAAAVLGRRCSVPALRALEQLLPDAVMASSADGAPRGWALPEKKMEGKARKMERLAAATVQLFQEKEILAEMERSLRRVQANASSSYSRMLPAEGGSLMDLADRVAGQRQAVKALREQSLWDRTHDYLLRLLATALFSVAVRINSVFAGHRGKLSIPASPACLPRSYSDLGRRAEPRSSFAEEFAARSGPITANVSVSAELPRLPLPRGKPWVWTRGPFLRGCALSVSGKDFPLLPRSLKPRVAAGGELQGLEPSLFDSKGKWICTPSPTTLGASALALRYANIILVIEKLTEYPHLIGQKAKDQLYSMLPTSLRGALRAKLKRPGAGDTLLAIEWRDAVWTILAWLSPLAHGTVTWHSERSFDQQQWSPRANVLLLQTLHFADRAKTEAATVELLVGLNFLWRSAKEAPESMRLLSAAEHSTIL